MMRTFIPWLIIGIAFIISTMEAIYGNPARIIAYSGIFIFMWYMDRYQKNK